MKIILLIVVFWFLVTSLWGFYSSLRPPKVVSAVNPQNFGLNYEEVSLITSDGLTLAGWFIPRPKPATAKTLILLHGYPADKGNILPALAFLNKTYNLLLFDFRYLGKSQGKYSTVGAKEKEDLKAALRFLLNRGIKEVGVWGLSLGGAVALMTAPEAPEIKAIVAEASYARLDRLTPELYPLPLLKKPLGWLTALWAKLFLGLNLSSISPAESAKLLTIPVLIIHSQADQIIPFSHARLLQEALKNNPRAEFLFPENILHGELIIEPRKTRGEEGRGYQKRLEEFFQKNL